MSLGEVAPMVTGAGSKRAPAECTALQPVQQWPALAAAWGGLPGRWNVPPSGKPFHWMFPLHKLQLLTKQDGAWGACGQQGVGC